MSHLVLIGDSIFDNGAYTGNGPDVVTQVRGLLPKEWAATLLAIDGSTTDEISAQLRRLPADATHLVLSVGGNNALPHLTVLSTPVSTVAQAIERLAGIADDFEGGYRTAVAGCLNAQLPLAVCTIYNGCFDDPLFQRMATATLALFNDAIIRVATEHRIPVIDLRAICAKTEDYANPIEPSSIGGEKIARVIVDLVSGLHVAPPTATRIIVA